jgi:hypothetical protein
MSACQRRLATMATLSALVLLAVSGCGGGNRTPASTKASTSPPSSSTGQTYATKAFKVPLTVTVDPYLGSPPTIDSPNLLSLGCVNLHREGQIPGAGQAVPP